MSENISVNVCVEGLGFSVAVYSLTTDKERGPSMRPNYQKMTFRLIRSATLNGWEV